MNTYKVKLTFPIEAEKTHGSSVLNMDIVAKNEESAILKAERTLPNSLLEWLISSEII